MLILYINIGSYAPEAHLPADCFGLRMKSCFDDLAPMATWRQLLDYGRLTAGSEPLDYPP